MRLSSTLRQIMQLGVQQQATDGAPGIVRGSALDRWGRPAGARPKHFPRAATGVAVGRWRSVRGRVHVDGGSTHECLSIRIRLYAECLVTLLSTPSHLSRFCTVAPPRERHKLVSRDAIDLGCYRACPGEVFLGVHEDIRGRGRSSVRTALRAGMSRSAAPVPTPRSSTSR